MIVYTCLFLVSGLLALALTPAVRRCAIALGALDQPDDRKVHREPIPRLGGLAVYLAVAITIGLGYAEGSLSIFLRDHAVLALAGTAIVLLGVADDLLNLKPATKITTQALAGLVLYWSGYGIEAFAGRPLGWMGLPLTLIWVVGVTNAFNLIDGLDGLAAGIALIVSAALFSVSVYSLDVAPAVLLATLAGALTGFLRYNFYPARIFLGDSGSLFLGFVLAVISMGVHNRASAVAAMVIPILALGLPLFETSLTVARRLLRGVAVVRDGSEREHYALRLARNTRLMTADRDHIHHRLLDLGLQHRTAVLVLYGVSAILGIASFGLVIARDLNLAFLLAAFGVAAVLGIRRLGYREMRFLRNGVLLPLFDSPLANRRMLHVLVDLLFILASFLGAMMILNEGVISPGVRSQFITEAPLLALVQIAAFGISGLYNRSYRYTGFSDLLGIAGAIVLAVAAAWAARTTAIAVPPLGLWVLQGYLLATLVILARLGFPIIEHLFKSERYGARRVLIYGAGRGGMAALGEIYNNAALDMVAVGFLDDDPARRNRTVRGLPIHLPDKLPELVGQKRFDELIIATGKIPEKRLRMVADLCALNGLGIRRFSFDWQTFDPRAAQGENDAAPAADLASAEHLGPASARRR